MIRRTVADGDRPFVGRGPRYLIRPDVLRAVASDLRAVEAVLADERRPVERGVDPCRRRHDARRHVPALLGSDPQAAADAARALRERVAPTAPAKVVTPTQAQAPAAR